MGSHGKFRNKETNGVPRAHRVESLDQLFFSFPKPWSVAQSKQIMIEQHQIEGNSDAASGILLHTKTYNGQLNNALQESPEPISHRKWFNKNTQNLTNLCVAPSNTSSPPTRPGPPICGCWNTMHNLVNGQSSIRLTTQLIILEFIPDKTLFFKINRWKVKYVFEVLRHEIH